MASEFRHGSTCAQVSGRRYVVLALVRPFGRTRSCEAQRLIPALLISVCRRDRNLIAEQWRAMRKQIVTHRSKHGVESGSSENFPAST